MQPTFNPWLGYFDLIDQSDVFVFYDDVQLSKQSWQLRNRIKTSNGELFLSIPFVKNEDWRELLIRDAKTNEKLPWRKKHLKSIENSYRKSTYFDEVFSFIQDTYTPSYESISSFNINFIKSISDKIGINSKFICSSDIKNMKGSKDVRLANICNYLNVSEYLSPQGSADYIEEYSPGGAIVKANINLFYHNYKHPIYHQINGDFIPYMGIVDLLFNLGFSKSLEIIRSGRLNSINYTQFKK